MTDETPLRIDLLASLIDAARTVVAFSGAGISTESGIPDFRSPGGIWTKYKPEDYTYQKFLASVESRRLAWERFRAIHALQAAPNPAHYALVDLERMGKLERLITQNIDGLHQKAGAAPERVIELHGNNNWVACLSCGDRSTAGDILARLEAGEAVPTCERCGGILKSTVISFGQPMPVEAMDEAERWSKQADLFVVIGSSLVVYPAAQMPVVALQNGARLAIINMTETSVDGFADVVIRDKAGVVLPRVVAALKQRQSA